MWFLVGLFFFIFGNWFLGLTSLDEGRNASVVLNMLSFKDLLVPYYNCQVRFEKPPMLYYFGLVFAKPFGSNEFSLRLVSGLSAFGVGIFTYLMAKLFFNRETALKSFLVLATLPHMWVESRAFVPEMLLTFFMLGGLYFLLINRTTLGWLFLAFAFLTKGPVGVFLPLGAYLILRRDLAFLQLRGILLFALGCVCGCFFQPCQKQTASLYNLFLSCPFHSLRLPPFHGLHKEGFNDSHCLPLRFKCGCVFL
jgi:4-amino-4-deoxy-L-arabinose transferase-like glycosyltransferase